MDEVRTWHTRLINGPSITVNACPLYDKNNSQINALSKINSLRSDTISEKN